MPLIVAGGPCAYNPEPLAPFFDLFMIGDGELVLPELCRLRQKFSEKRRFLEEAARIRGVYVPSFYDVSYNEDGTVREYTNNENAPEKVLRCIIDDLEGSGLP